MALLLQGESDNGGAPLEAAVCEINETKSTELIKRGVVRCGERSVVKERASHIATMAITMLSYRVCQARGGLLGLSTSPTLLQSVIQWLACARVLGVSVSCCAMVSDAARLALQRFFVLPLGRL